MTTPEVTTVGVRYVEIASEPVASPARPQRFARCRVILIERQSHDPLCEAHADTVVDTVREGRVERRNRTDRLEREPLGPLKSPTPLPDMTMNIRVHSTLIRP